jgi:hypothetical protein
MSTPLPVPLTVVASLGNQYYWGQIAIGKNVLTQQPSGPGFWFLVLDRSTLAVVANLYQPADQSSTVPNLSAYNDTNHILIVNTLGVGLNNTPQGALFKFIDQNGGGRQLRRVEQVGMQLNCGSLGTYAYAMVGVMGNLDLPGFENSQISQPAVGPILTLQLLPMDVNGQTVYTPAELSGR